LGEDTLLDGYIYDEIPTIASHFQAFVLFMKEQDGMKGSGTDRETSKIAWRFCLFVYLDGWHYCYLLGHCDEFAELIECDEFCF
jgi:hypothetical protein